MNLTEYLFIIGPLYLLFVYTSTKLLDENKTTKYDYVDAIIIGNMIGITLAVAYYLIKCH